MRSALGIIFAFVVWLAAASNCAVLAATSDSSHKVRIGLVLGGGGTRGAAHIGVLRVLEREGIHVDMVTGTSIGAIVGGLYCSGRSVDEIESEFENPRIMRSYMTVPIWLRVMAIPIFLVPRLAGWKPYDGFYFGNKFRKYYESCLPADRRNFEELKTPFRAMTFDLTNCEPYVISKGNVARAVQASSAIPILRRPVPFGEHSLLVDGAVQINLPVDEAKKMGADFVIAVPVSEHILPWPRHSFRRIGSVARRMEQVFLSQTDAQEMHLADVVIHPHTYGIDVLSTRRKDALRAIEEGEKAATAALPEIREKLAHLEMPL
jgi:NTE family protein